MQGAVDPEDVEIEDWLEEEDEPDEEIEVETVFLFVEDVMRYCLMYWNIEWEAPDHRYEERFYENRTTYFSVIIGKAVVHYCLRDFCVEQLRSTLFEFGEWTLWPEHSARYEVRQLIEAFMVTIPMAENRRGIAILCLGGVLCERAMKLDRPLLVNVVVQEIVYAVYIRIPYENYFVEFRRSSHAYVMIHRQLHRRSRDEGFIEGSSDTREVLY